MLDVVRAYGSHQSDAAMKRAQAGSDIRAQLTDPNVLHDLGTAAKSIWGVAKSAGRAALTNPLGINQPPIDQWTQQQGVGVDLGRLTTLPQRLRDAWNTMTPDEAAGMGGTVAGMALLPLVAHGATQISPSGLAAGAKTLASDIPVVKQFGPALTAYQRASLSPAEQEAAEIADTIAAKQRAGRIKTAVDAAVPPTPRAGTLRTVKPPPIKWQAEPPAETPVPAPPIRFRDEAPTETPVPPPPIRFRDEPQAASPVAPPPIRFPDEPAAATPVPPPPIRFQEDAPAPTRRPVPAPPIKWRGEPSEAAGEPPAAPPPVTEPPPAAEPPAKTDEELGRGQTGARDEGRTTGKTTEEVRGTSRNRFTGETGVKSGLPLQVKTRLHAFADDAMARNASPQEYIDYVNAGREPDRIQIGQALESYVMGKGRPSPFPVLAGAAVGGGAMLRKALVDQLGGQDQEQE
jgi:hypothetical protein